tara:strand:- start:17301 stop:17894 length:594 start_codon:yes stop_codon:yes gene_type:complete
MKTDLPHPKKPYKERSLGAMLIMGFFILILLVCVLAPIVMGLSEFITAQSSFNKAFVLYSGMSGLLIAIVWSLLILGIFMLTKMSPDVDTKKSKLISALFGALFFGLWIWIFYSFERPLTLYYVDHYINKEGTEYVLCDGKHKTTNKSQYSQIFVYARNDVGCSPYDALKLRTLDKPSDREKIERLNADYDHINKQD